MLSMFDLFPHFSSDNSSKKLHWNHCSCPLESHSDKSSFHLSMSLTGTTNAIFSSFFSSNESTTFSSIFIMLYTLPLTK
uniref:Uncharacterized protein n=1 Tax=Ciona intestinalis TaxID=7719 RepID=H2Y293_CIOIN